METPDKIVKKENQEFLRVMELLRKILDDFGKSEFTFKDIKDNLTEATEINLDYLVQKEALFYDEKTKEYFVNHNSSYVAKLELEGEREVE